MAAATATATSPTGSATEAAGSSAWGPTAATPTASRAQAGSGSLRPDTGIALSRIANAGCYVLAGVALLILSAQPNVPTVWPLLLGLAAMGYGAKILLTRTSYWISSLVYVLAILAVAATLKVVGAG